MGYGIDFVDWQSADPPGDLSALTNFHRENDGAGFHRDFVVHWRKIVTAVNPLMWGASERTADDEHVLWHAETGIRISQLPGYLWLEVPFWRMDEWALMTRHLVEIASRIQDASGLRAFDPAEIDWFVTGRYATNDISDSELRAFRRRRRLIDPGSESPD
jgi:hypothetical protein